MIDLHLHTTCSDGQYTPSELVAKAKAAGITAMSITDHDTAKGVPEAQQAAQEAGIRLISGIEISTTGNRELHILGYGIQPDHPRLQAFCEEHRRNRAERSIRLVSYLQEQGVPITLEEVRRCNDGAATGRPHFAKAIVAAGYAASIQDAFDRYLTTAAFYERVERPKPSPEAGMQVILQSSGIPVLAHPCRLKLEQDALRQLLQRLVAGGLQGMECYYSRNTSEQTQQYLQLAEAFRLLVTCGSDFHGEAVKPEIQLGTGIAGNLCCADETLVDRLEAAIAAHRKNWQSSL